MTDRLAGEFTKLSDVQEDQDLDRTRFGLIEILGANGDTKKKWDRNNQDEVADARDSFSRLTKKGFSAFRVGPKGEQGGRMDTFEPEAEGMILVPAIAGGRP